MRKPNGFSLIEMIMVFTIAGLLLVVVGTQLASFRSRAVVSALKTDLRNLAVAQESFYYDNDVYAPDTTTLFARDYSVSPGARVEINEATLTGWAATASHDHTTQRCYMFIPGASPIGLAIEPGLIRCG